MSMNTFKFWGVDDRGARDLIGMCNAKDMGDAFLLWPVLTTPAVLADYVRIEIVREGSVDDALSALPKLRRVK